MKLSVGQEADQISELYFPILVKILDKHPVFNASVPGIELTNTTISILLSSWADNKYNLVLAENGETVSEWQ